MVNCFSFSGEEMAMENIYVTKSYLPPREEFFKYASEIFDNCILTNEGPFSRLLAEKIRHFLDIDNFSYVTNGTVALQLALKSMNITEGEVITTPFSYVATVSSILWERCHPVFVDIERENFTIDPDKIEEKITEKTQAIMPVHVFGYACNVKKIEKIAKKYNLKVIYDAAHTFGTRYGGRSLCSYGDISTLSFHATKLFHTIEGGGCIVNDRETFRKLELMKRFGHEGDNHIMLGINAKQDEFNAAMGLANLGHIDEIVAERKRISELYDSLLEGRLRRPKKQEGLEYNYAYYPVLFESEKELLAAFERLARINVYPRRYFYPSLNTLPYLRETCGCPVSEDIASRIACLPLFVGLENELVYKICKNL